MNNQLKFTLRDIISRFNFKKLAGDDSKLDTIITVPGINRAGLELTGFSSKTKNLSHRIVWLSNKENEYIQTLTPKERQERYEKLIASHIPAIFINFNFKDEVLLKVAKEKNFPVIEVGYSTEQFYTLVGNFIDSNLAKIIEEHGSLVNIFGLGVLIKGKSGIGKSENVLELIKKGHLFIGDDRIILQQQAQRIIGWSAKQIKNLIEIRGIGILDITKMYGVQQVLEQSQIDLIIYLKNIEDKDIKIERLGADFNTEKIFNINIPVINIPVSLGRNIADLVEVAAIRLKLKNNGFDIVKELNNQLRGTKKDDK